MGLSKAESFHLEHFLSFMFQKEESEWTKQEKKKKSTLPNKEGFKKEAKTVGIVQL